jgi:hypothetical protein
LRKKEQSRAAYVDRTAIHQLLLIPELHVVGGVGVLLAGRQSVQLTGGLCRINFKVGEPRRNSHHSLMDKTIKKH